MKLARDLAVIAVTAVLAAPFARPRTARAEGAALPPVPPAVLDLDGVRVTIVAKPATSGTEVVATLTAVNRGDAGATRKVPVGLLVSPKPDRMSRMLMAPREKWTREIALRLAPHEKKTIELRTGVKLAAGETASFAAGDKRLRLVRLLSAKPKAQKDRKTP